MRLYGGEWGIRTPDRAFRPYNGLATAAFSHSANSPSLKQAFAIISRCLSPWTAAKVDLCHILKLQLRFRQASRAGGVLVRLIPMLSMGSEVTDRKRRVTVGECSS